MTPYLCRLAGLLLAATVLLNAADDPFQPRERLTARTFNSGFVDAHDTYNGMGCGSDGHIYYVLSSERYDVGARMFGFDPATRKIRLIGDLTEACGEQGRNTIVQGKSHVNFAERGGKLHFSTHIGFYSIIDGMEKPGIPPAGWKPYPGGHLLSYDLKSGKFEDFGVGPEREGILTTSTDKRRGRCMASPGPRVFLPYDLAKKSGRTRDSRREEDGKGDTYRTLAARLRSIWTTARRTSASDV